MSNDAHPLAARSRSRRSPLNNTSSSFSSGSGGRTVLPPLTGFRSGGDTFSAEVPVDPSRPPNGMFEPAYDSHWGHHNGMMAGHQPFYAPFEHIDHRPPTSSSPPRSSMAYRQSPPVPQQERRGVPPISIPRLPADFGQIYHGGHHYGLESMDDSDIHSPSLAYPLSYDDFHAPNTYPPFHHHATYDPRHIPHAAGHYPPELHHGLHRPGHPSDYAGIPPARSETHLVSPYARREAQENSPIDMPSADFPVKRKRKRADANQLKILNDVYERTAFPTTEERIELSKKLGMTPRSVQIWFQNKRQAARQNRNSAHAMPPMTTAAPPRPPPQPEYTHSVSRHQGELSVSPSSHGSHHLSRSPGFRPSSAAKREPSPAPRPMPPPDMYHRGRSPDPRVFSRRPGY